ncbi:phenylalanine ammonia-lyase [Phakopsora pachyrhizi]|nr:phenylalanine ammonia-lyase [Phakopsora pachyrhizi]
MEVSLTEGHTNLCIDALTELQNLQSKSAILTLDGKNLSPAAIVGTSRYSVQPTITKDKDVLHQVEETVEFLASKLDTAIYGVTTLGSADTRTNNPMALQMAFLEHQISGILPLPQATKNSLTYLTDPMTNIIPEAITRGAILIRINSLIRGHSAVRLVVLEALLSLLNKKLTPMVPLRGSISASGDLMPLSYVAAAICGHPAIRIIDRSSSNGEVVILTASEALAKHGITPIVLGPKEGLGISNGTAFSASAACLAAHDSHMLALFSQVLTAMTTEAMMGQVGFIHEVCRPHPGQVEVAKNIMKMLKGSRLAIESEGDRYVKDEADQALLRQDRYPLRTSPQWIGPQVEDLYHINKTLICEINSTTDNPLVDLNSKKIHNGGNFQAMSVTRAMEKTRTSLESIGKLCFAQASELMNCAMNKGLPSCLAGSEPSTNYHTKGLDINISAYTAELGFLASPVASHVQSAEQHNQAVNSMALVSARYTIQAVEVLSMLLSAHLYIVCMAIDLRVIEQIFQQKLSELVPSLLRAHFTPHINFPTKALTSAVIRRLEHNSSLDSEARFLDAFKTTSHIILDENIDMSKLKSWPQFASSEISPLYRDTRDGYFDLVSCGKELAEPWMGEETKIFYRFVRQKLGIKPRKGDVVIGQPTGSVSEDVSLIFEAMRSGEIFQYLKNLT